MLRVVQDSLERYWIGQGDELAVFDADGTFVTKVGRAGEGPMEFSAVRPIGVDANGRVHVLDNRNKRVTAIREDFSVAGETVVPGGFVRDMVVFSPETSTSGQYVLQTWISSLDRIGLALHRLSADGRIVSSFGPRPTSASGPMTPMLMERELALHPIGTVFSADRLAYVVEAWASDGSRVGKLSGPTLDNGFTREPGPWTLDNPPSNTLRDIHVDRDGRLWVMLVYRRPNWEDLVVEKTRSTGQVYLEYPEGGPGSLFRTRVEVIDVQACVVRASGWFEHTSIGYFLLREEDETPSVTGLAYSPLGEPFVEIWDIKASR